MMDSPSPKQNEDQNDDGDGREGAATAPPEVSMASPAAASAAGDREQGQPPHRQHEEEQGHGQQPRPHYPGRQVVLLRGRFTRTESGLLTLLCLAASLNVAVNLYDRLDGRPWHHQMNNEATEESLGQNSIVGIPDYYSPSSTNSLRPMLLRAAVDRLQRSRGRRRRRRSRRRLSVEEGGTIDGAGRDDHERRSLHGDVHVHARGSDGGETPPQGGPRDAPPPNGVGGGLTMQKQSQSPRLFFEEGVKIPRIVDPDPPGLGSPSPLSLQLSSLSNGVKHGEEGSSSSSEGKGGSKKTSKKKKKRGKKGDSAKAKLKKLWEEMAFDDDDEDAPPGPSGGFDHTDPFHTTADEQIVYNQAVENAMHLQFHQSGNIAFADAFGGDGGGMMHKTEIARPEGATTSYYTGVAHFRHVNNPRMVTFVFSAGRHDGGSNTYVTVDVSGGGGSSSAPFRSPFDGAQESYVDPDAGDSTYTWASTYSVVKEGSSPDDVVVVEHYALFSGGSGNGITGPSKLYLFKETAEGIIQTPRLVWCEPVDVGQRTSARYGLLADLGYVFDNGQAISRPGVPDIIITGTGGLDVYSHNNTGGWELIRSSPIPAGNHRNGTAAYMGVVHIEPPPHSSGGGYLIVTARARWSSLNMELDAPCIVYDYRADEVVGEFARGGQTVSIAALDNGGGTSVILGAGGQTARTGAPNLIYDVKAVVPSEAETGGAKEGGRDWSISLELSPSDAQLARGMPREYEPFDVDNPIPISSSNYFVIPAPGNTKTRQVVPFRLNDAATATQVLDVQGTSSSKGPSSSSSRKKSGGRGGKGSKSSSSSGVRVAGGRGGGADLVLEVNSAQTSNVYVRGGGGADGDYSGAAARRILPLPGSEGSDSHYARAADVLVEGDWVHVVLAMYNGNNTVYSFRTDLLMVDAS